MFLAGCFNLEHKQGEFPSWLSLIKLHVIVWKEASL